MWVISWYRKRHFGTYQEIHMFSTSVQKTCIAARTLLILAVRMICDFYLQLAVQRPNRLGH
jgi:hypothetical protein